MVEYSSKSAKSSVKDKIISDEGNLNNDNILAALCYLFPLVSIIVYFVGNSDYLKENAKNSLNLDINFLITIIFSLFIFLIIGIFYFISFILILFNPIFFILAILIVIIFFVIQGIISIFSLIFFVFNIVGAIKAYNGEVYEFPFIIKFLK
jgi:uncharacterized protein